MMGFQFYERAALGNIVGSLSIAALVSLLPNGALAQTPSTDNTLLRLIETAKSGGLQSGEIILADRSGISADQAFGLADKETGRINQRGANWLWASVTKQITAVLILQLVEEGKLSLEGAISAYLPEFTGAYAKQITVKQLEKAFALWQAEYREDPDEFNTDEDIAAETVEEYGASCAETLLGHVKTIKALEKLS